MASSNGGGYEHEFLEPSAKLKKYECPLCLHATREPYLTDCCGQHFCQACINRIVTDRKPCPLYKTSSFHMMIDKKQKRRVLELKVKCTMKERGCDWSGELGKLDTHVDAQNGSCQFVDVNCPNNCGESHQRCYLANHLSDLCPKRPFTCKFCQFKATYEQVCNDHYPKCVKYPVPCPNKCDIRTVERSNLEQHVSECPLQVVECEFAIAGCSEKITRTDLPKHMELSVQKHLVLVSSYCVKEMTSVRGKLDQKDKLLTELQGELAETKKDTATKLAELQRKLKTLAEKDKQVEARVHNTERGVEVLQGRVRTPEMFTCLPLPIKFTLANFSQHEGMYKRVEGPVLCTVPKIQIKFYFEGVLPRMEVELYQRPGESDDRMKWPVKCTVTATLLNQSSDQHHISSRQDYVLHRPTKERRIDPDVSYVHYSTIEDCSQPDRLYLKDDNLKFRFVYDCNWCIY